MKRDDEMRIVVTGGAGFIGSAVVRHLVLETGAQVLTIDKLTYAGTLTCLKAVDGHPNHRFVQADICDEIAVGRAVSEFRPERIIHLAAETHVDRSITGAKAFVETNAVGTFTLLEVARNYWLTLDAPAQRSFRFLHVSTDEVYGSLGDSGLFSETTPYDPASPYAASKAASDHLVMAWHRTYGLPVVISNCSNNYGPYQFPEKLVPLVILNAMEGKPLPVYGAGTNVRDWLHVDEPCPRARLDRIARAAGGKVQCRRPQRAPQHRRRATHRAGHGRAAARRCAAPAPDHFGGRSSGP
jgi:dTDP-glucose 4,6-dehydratase